MHATSEYMGKNWSRTKPSQTTNKAIARYTCTAQLIELPSFLHLINRSKRGWKKKSRKGTMTRRLWIEKHISRSSWQQATKSQLKFSEKERESTRSTRSREAFELTELREKTERQQTEKLLSQLLPLHREKQKEKRQGDKIVLPPYMACTSMCFGYLHWRNACHSNSSKHLCIGIVQGLWRTLDDLQ
jgi:hypothetical protein